MKTLISIVAAFALSTGAIAAEKHLCNCPEAFKAKSAKVKTEAKCKKLNAECKWEKAEAAPAAAPAPEAAPAPAPAPEAAK